MTPGFFRSREFVIALVVGLLVVAGGVAALGSAFGASESVSGEGCTVPAPEGAPVAARVEDTGVFAEAGRPTRVVTYTLDAPPSRDTLAQLCTSVGDLTVKPSEDGATRVTFTIHARHAAGRDAVEATRVDAAFADGPQGLGVSASQEPQRYSVSFFGRSTTTVHLVVELPEEGRHDVKASTDVGDVLVTGLRLAKLDLATDVGDVDVSDSDAGGDARVATSVGDVTLAFRSVESMTLSVDTSVGEASLTLPSRADVGYDVRADANVGDVEVDIGDAELNERQSSGASEDARVRSRGYDAKPTQVSVDVTTSVGDITVTAA